METDIIKSYIKELQKGSHKAFNVIYDMYADKLYGFLLAHTKSRQMSEDIVQDTFLKLWINRKTLSTDGSLQSFLYTISKHEMIDLFRSQINKVEFELYVEYIDEKKLDYNDIEKKLFYDDFLKALKLSKKLLSEKQLEIFELSKEKGKSIEEIATQLQISEQTVKNHLTTSLKKIRTQLSNMNILFLIIFEICFITQ